MNKKNSRMISSAIIATMLLLGMVLAIAPVEARLAPPGNQYDRQAMISEATYAVMGPYYGPPYGTGKWNYMESDISAQQKIRNKIDPSNAGWTTQIINNKVPYGYYENAGRGGQCFFFVDLILYRSGSIAEDKLPYNWGQIEASWKSIDEAKSGDVIFKPRSIGRHIAILTIRSGDYATVVESNYGYTEKITHRQTTISALKNAGYRVYTGVDYINYNP